MQDLDVTIVQCELVWEDAAANLALFERRFKESVGRTDLVVLPEMFTTGFSMNAEKLAEEMTGETVAWMRETALAGKTAVTGSFIARDAGRFYNRLIWVQSDGTLHVYDKKHLFRMSGEHEIYSAGDKNITLVLKGWRIRPFICYDLRFPSWTRNVDNAYDAAVFVANWPAPRSMHWRTLLRARAIENLSYVIGVNRIGKDGNGRMYDGCSSIIGPAGEIICQKKQEPAIHTARLSHASLEVYRESFPAWMDADDPVAAGREVER
ncbi:MAG: amidohydrolase [Deltaproteobacteria bacterium]|nr:amidohydrolase [Deltaproteobacteria bacterium]